MQKPIFIENQIYHIYNRGVEKRSIFIDNQDYTRFIHCLFEFNDKNPVKNFSRVEMNEFRSDSLRDNVAERKQKNKPRKLLVEILAFVLMPNHFHLLLQQKVDEGIVRFMQKIGIAHTMYFNQKYERVGPLFQGRFKAVLVEKDAHFLYLPHYIHLNPLDLINESDRNSLIGKMTFLENYRWSSLPDYIGKKNFPSVTQRDFLLESFDGTEGYKKDIKEWVEGNNKDFNQISAVLLDGDE